MTFVLDENVSPRLAQILDIFDQQNEIRHLLDTFPAGTRDLDWLTSIGQWQPKPTVLGGDGRILKNAAERAALREAGLTFVYLARGWMKMPFRDQAWKLLKAWPGVLEGVSHVQSATIFELSVGTLKLRRIGWT